MTRAEIQEQLEAYLLDWKGTLCGSVAQGQGVLRRLIQGRLQFVPKDGYYEFRGIGTVRPLIAGVVQKLVHPGGLEPPTFWSVARRSIQLS